MELRQSECSVADRRSYPHFIQQFSFCAFDADKDHEITEADVNAGAFGENGAMDQLAKRYYNQMYFEKIWSDDYRKVLHAMTEHMDNWVTRALIIKQSGVKESQVNNALAALKNRGIILANEQKKGEYRLPTKAFAVWLRAVSTGGYTPQQPSPTASLGVSAT
jgi:hypothetical protein